MLMSDYVMHHPYQLAAGGGGSVGGTSSMSALSASDTMSGSVGGGSSHHRGGGGHRVRTVRLVRPNSGALPPPGLTGCRHGPTLGFSVRGGREHGTGFFVSHVELGSEAHRQGLRIGDQIVRINGFTVEDAVHKEVLQLISNHTHLTLKVRSVGMIPVKEKRCDSLSWQIISDCNSSTHSSSPQLGEKNHDVRITISVAPRAKLGCGICKGPEWKPGIFIQFTKEGGIAREAGLRPGDQILACNGVDFGDIAFNEAVALMKASRQLELAVRKAAGSELFPGESSGYNSSASSVTGDQSPSWSDSKRLSIVKEETMDLEDRLTHLQLAHKKWEKIEWDDVDGDSDKSSSGGSSNYYKPTIINLSEHGTTIKNNGTAEECKGEEEYALPTKTVVVEIHRSDEAVVKTPVAKTASVSSYASLASSTSSTQSSQATSLSSAISQELLRRSEKSKTTTAESQLSIDEQLQMKKQHLMKNVDAEKQQQHHKLMDEFRKAHKKMFKSTDGDGVAGDDGVDDNKDRTNGYRTVSDCREFPEEVNDRLNQLINNEPPERNCLVLASGHHHQRQQQPLSNVPPPPPPLPNGHQAAPPPPRMQTQTIKPKQKAPPPPVPIKTSTLSTFSTFHHHHNHQPPPCPTPDYDTLSLTSNSTLPRAPTKKPLTANRSATSHTPNNHALPTQSPTDAAVEMESLDSFAIHNPASNPKPPSTYFAAPAAADVSKRPLCNVTIGEYAGGVRKAPAKFDFLGAPPPPPPMADNAIASQFASELAQTLHRSNLRRRTDSMENLLNHPQIMRNDENGSVRIAVGNGASNRNMSNLDAISKALQNRVKINIAPDASASGKQPQPPPMNGILKNGAGDATGNGRL